MSDGHSTRRKIRDRRALALADAAFYVGVSVNKFKELLADGRMPPPKRIDDIRRWDVEALDIYFSQLPDDLRSSAQRAPGRVAGVALRPASSINRSS